MTSIDIDHEPSRCYKHTKTMDSLIKIFVAKSYFAEEKSVGLRCESRESHEFVRCHVQRNRTEFAIERDAKANY